MRTLFLLICCMIPTAVHAVQTCKTDSIPSSTPDSQLVDNRDSTVTDRKTGLMWKKCVEGLSGDNCEIGSPASFTWQQALQQPGIINNSNGFAGHTDWRLPNIRELRSIVEEQCINPAINMKRFPNFPNTTDSDSVVWSGSPYAHMPDYAWRVYFPTGGSGISLRNGSFTVWLVRSRH